MRKSAQGQYWKKKMQFQFYQENVHRPCVMKTDESLYFYYGGHDAFRRELNIVDLFDAAPKLMMSSTSWKDKSLWFNTNEDYGLFHCPKQKKVDELIKGKENQEMEKIAVLTHWAAD